ncbi:putative membrane protein SpoIIM required for sporulation [Sporosarcina luteola]|nr:putative membrane protein SpoIIM required for sporulation [Sporosarcina luteola]
MKKVWLYVVNNGFVVPLQMFALTLIPIQFLYVVNIISTASMPGILFGIVLQLDSRKGMEIIASTVPHFVIEIFGFCLLAAVLFELNRGVRSKIKNWFKKDQKELSLVDKVFKTLRIYVAVVLPMIVVAAFVETYVADIIFNLFQL